MTKRHSVRKPLWSSGDIAGVELLAILLEDLQLPLIQLPWLFENADWRVDSLLIIDIYELDAIHLLRSYSLVTIGWDL